MIRLVYPGEKLLRHISAGSTETRDLNDRGPVQPNLRLLRQTDTIIDIIQPKATCLIRSLVKRDVLRNYGISTTLCFGLMKEGDRFIAHSWLTVENSGGFSKVYQVS